MNRIITGTDNETFLRLCVQARVDFLLVGGAAVLHHGCRPTEEGLAEIDILIDRSTENARRLLPLLQRIFAEAGLIPHDLTLERLQQPKLQIPLKSQRHRYNLDVLTPWEELSYADLRSRSKAGLIGSIEVRVVSKADLIALKEYAITHELEAQKHEKDLDCLRG